MSACGAFFARIERARRSGDGEALNLALSAYYEHRDICVECRQYELQGCAPVTAVVVYLYECTVCHWVYPSPVPLPALRHGTCQEADRPRMVPVPEPVP